MYHGVNGKLRAKAGEGGRLLAILLEAARGMEEVDGCLCYLVGTEPEKPEEVWVFEVWECEAAHQDSLRLPVFRTLIAQAMPLIDGMENLPSLAIHGGKTRPIR